MSDSEKVQEKNPQNTAAGSFFSKSWKAASESQSVAEYRSVSLSAIISLVLGILSVTFLFHWGFFFVPILAFFFAVLALVRFRFTGEMLWGHWMPPIAMFLALFFTAFHYTMWFCFDRILMTQARQFAPLVFDALKEDDLPRYLELQRLRFQRQKTVSSIEERWKPLGKSEEEAESIDMLTKETLLRTLIALGDKADVTFYKSGGVSHDTSDYVSLIYAVTYPNGTGEKETFFVKVFLQRILDEVTEQGVTVVRAGWKFNSLKGPILPKEFGGNDGLENNGR
ncbi:MAG: DUF4190 domain-containing protein [Planctomycetaceae bacterium]|jgi:hypothetical protein|nr:DUF4190 domain-containing protein [Planctomycetaceae bacterium]